MFCHRFYAVHAHNGAEHDWKVVAPACLFLAGKVEETPKALRDVVYVSHLLRNRKDVETATEQLRDKVRAVAYGNPRPRPRAQLRSPARRAVPCR